MFDVVGGVDEDVIHVYRCILLTTLHHVMHDPLKGWRRVHKAKREHCPLKVVGSANGDRCDERGQGNRFFCHGNLIIPLLEVDFRKDL